MSQTMIRELAKQLRQAFAQHQAIKVPVLRKAEFSCLMNEIRLSEPLVSFLARQR